VILFGVERICGHFCGQAGKPSSGFDAVQIQSFGVIKPLLAFGCLPELSLNSTPPDAQSAASISDKTMLTSLASPPQHVSPRGAKCALDNEFVTLMGSGKRQSAGVR
jgi:hypothetical protein